MINLYAILDNKANALAGNIIMQRNHAAAVRIFTDVLKDDSRNNLVAAHPEDFDLYQMGFLDDETLTIEPYKVVILTGAAWKASTDAANAADNQQVMERAL